MLNNPWVIGIGGGILSGLIVTWLSRLLLSKKEDREYLQKVMSANRDVIYAIRPGISEGQVPSPQVIEALRQATARRYGIELRDLYTLQQLSEELIKEVMDSSFISSVKKAEFCDQLSNMIKLRESSETPVLEKATLEIIERTKVSDYRQRYISMLSLMAGLLTTSMTVLIVFNSRVSPGKDDGISSHLDLFLPAITALATVTVAMAFYALQRQVRASKGSAEKQQETALHKRVDRPDDPPDRARKADNS